MLNIRRLSANAAGFRKELDTLLAWETVSNESVNNVVKEVVEKVRTEGDAALLEYTARFDRMSLNSGAELEISMERIQQALKNIPADQREALELSAERVKAYHEKQINESWSYTEADGTMLGQQVTPLDSVGLYVPGGKAAYPSSVIMNAIPAKVAGVKTLIMVVPTPDGEVNEMVLAAAAICGVDRVFTLGGAQAVAALAYGTQTVPAVDKIVGPGNIYVATAKRMVFGTVGIDMIAGPSEILVYCDGKTNPDWIAVDLFSQAEHDEDAQAILVTQDADFAEKVYESMNRLLPTMPRQAIIRKALDDRGAIIVVDNEDQAIEMINVIAPEHLELSVDDPKALLPKIRHAGAIFMGRYTAEALGDYCAGPNHVLPTSRTARFSSPLGVYDFQKRSSLIMCSEDGANMLGQVAGILADGEGLQAHAASARYRVKS
ncbi:histidinol dehydrogenase [Thiomicrorhabdus cannonii]|uniref:histidinol dehydrogenase n=1 Tax=Thiomicrorhabdus cannonii TaxID=2748011 RepID=UPI0015BE02BD|nr:histidinol dehydrogenase [Thiomicrorhabdus cannonii]